MNIQELIQKEVDRITKQEYSEDTCQPVFIVSIYNQTLVLTCKHNSLAFSDRLFPDGSMTYGLKSLKDKMSNLYNRTM